ncbi:glycosyltransferase [Flavobacterium sp.]|uniref:glycosyltransferase n=1 Tax=Flavobacterium sp. TaxID=239 RepID=UPI0040482EE9
MVDRKRICLVIPSLHAGGMERVMSELAHYFCKKKEYEVHLILYGLTREIFYDIPENIIVHKPKFEFNNSKRTWNTLKTLWFLRNKIKSIHPDTILSFGELWNNFVLLATIGLRFPIYVSDRCQPDKSLGKLHDSLRKLLYPRAKGIIAQTQIAKEMYSNQFKHNNIDVIGNPIRAVQLNDKIEKENIVLSVGRLIKSKQHDELIKLFVKIKKPNWKLVIVGDDALKQNNMSKLKVLIKELNVEENIILAGKQNDVDTYYLKSRIFAFTSSSEGFPNVIGEAQSAGLPVIAFDCIAGPSDLIKNNQNGYLIPLNNYEKFEEKLRYLMESDDERLRLGENAKKTVREFEANKIADKFYNFIIN